MTSYRIEKFSVSERLSTCVGSWWKQEVELLYFIAKTTHSDSDIPDIIE